MSHKRTVFLQSEQVDLVILEGSDASSLVIWMNDQTVTQFLGRRNQPYTLEFEEEWIAKAYKDPNHLILGIWHKKDQKLIGTISLALINQVNQNAELRISIGDAEYWSGGYGSEAVNTLVTFAFKVKNLHLVYLSVYSHNPRAVRCYEKCGFTKAGTIPEYCYHDGQWSDEHLMYIKNPDHT